MADAWIQMRVTLPRCPQVVRLASAFDADKCPLPVRMLSAVGALHATWSLFDTHSADGLMRGYTLDAIDLAVGVTGWGQAMVDVGWLVVTADGVQVYEWEKHNGTSAKRRAQEADRKRTVRKTSGQTSARDADALRTPSSSSSYSLSSSLSSDSEGEPEREVPPHADDEPAPRARRDQLEKVLAEAEFAGAPATTLATVRVEAERWRDFRREAKLGAWTATTWRTAIRGALVDPAAFAASVAQSIAHGWQGLFPPRPEGQARNGERLTAHEQANQRRHAEIGAITDFLLNQFPDPTTPALIEGAKR